MNADLPNSCQKITVLAFVKMWLRLSSYHTAFYVLALLSLSIGKPAKKLPRPSLSTSRTVSIEYNSWATSTKPVPPAVEVRSAHRLAIYSASRHTQIVPVQYAASSLWLFYTAIQRQALGPWASTPMKVDLWVTLGNLHICFASLHGVPWSFVAWFAGKMLTATLRGYTGTYDQMYLDPYNPDHGGVIVWLRVIDPTTGHDVD